MFRYTRFLRPLALAVFLIGCQLPRSPGEPTGAASGALLEVVPADCARAMLERYAECERLDCQPNPLVRRPVDPRCQRNCRAEAELAYEECADDAGELLTLEELERLEVPVWSQPDYRIEEHARRIVPDCPECGSL